MFRIARGDRPISTSVAAQVLGVSSDTATRYAVEFGIGWQPRKGAHWRFSLVAVRMLASGDMEALKAYIAGDASSSLVASYLQSSRSYLGMG